MNQKTTKQHKKTHLGDDAEMAAQVLQTHLARVEAVHLYIFRQSSQAVSQSVAPPGMSISISIPKYVPIPRGDRQIYHPMQH